MNKHNLLRAAIVAAFPAELTRNPDRLSVFIDKGRIAARYDTSPARGTGFEYRYQLIAILTDFTGDTNLLMATLVDWLHLHQPDRLLNHDKGNEAFRFEAVILDDKKADVEIRIDVEEAVNVSRDAQGDMVFAQAPEPAVAGGDPTADPDARIREILSGGEGLFGPT